MNVENYTLTNVVDMTDFCVGHGFSITLLEFFCNVIHREIKEFLVTWVGQYSYSLCMSLHCTKCLLCES